MTPTLNHSKNPRGRRVLVQALSCVVFLTGLTGVVAGLSPQRVEASSLDDARSDYTTLSLQVDNLRDQRRKLEGRYKKLTGQIEARKRARQGAALIADIELGNMLKEARSLSGQLTALQGRIRKAEGAQERTRREVLAAYDGQIVELEETIINGDDEFARAGAISQLNALRQARHAYEGRVQATPDLKLDELPTLDDAPVNDPEEAAAQAAELDDARSLIDARIDNLKGEIERLEQDKRLRRKAQGFRDRENFFDENTTGGRRVARGAGGARTQFGTDPGRGNQGDGAPQADEATNDDEGGEALAGDGDDFADNEAPPAADPAPEGDDRDNDGPGEDPVDLASDNNRGGAVERQPEVGRPDVLPGSGLPSDPFSSDPFIVVEGEVEPLDGDLREGEGDGGSIEQKIKRLKQKKKALESKSTELESRSRSLKERAEQ